MKLLVQRDARWVGDHLNAARGLAEILIAVEKARRELLLRWTMARVLNRPEIQSSEDLVGCVLSRLQTMSAMPAGGQLSKMRLLALHVSPPAAHNCDEKGSLQRRWQVRVVTILLVTSKVQSKRERLFKRSLSDRRTGLSADA